MDSFKASSKAKDNEQNEDEIPAKPLGDPIPAPHPNECLKASLPPEARKINCCPPKTDKEMKDFKFPDMRVRPAAHLAVNNQKYMEKFSKALQLMKELPDSDPRSFNNQAGVHCAYCVGGYRQVGYPNLKIQVHHSWLFLPFHRWYLYFFERILGKLIKDPTFAIPFWNWDSPACMVMPSLYTKKESLFYDRHRDANHQPPTTIDLNFDHKEYTSDNFDDKEYTSGPNEDLIAQNLCLMYKQVVSGATTAELFLGSAYRAGDEDNSCGGGTLEHVPHNTVHDWCGDPRQPNREDMGHFYSAGYDPIFFGHHSNVDRLWSVWKECLGRQDFTDPDWLNASFSFYDENGDLVRVYVKDCVDTRRLGYIYEEVDIPWLSVKPTPHVKGAVTPREGVPWADEVFPANRDVINDTVKVMVRRPKKLRSKEEKEKEEEVLLIDGIEVERNVYVKFDVFINEVDEATSGPHKTEWAGSFVSLRPLHEMKTSLRLGISELLEDLGAEGDEKVMVTLVPKTQAGPVSIGAVKIGYLSK